MAARLIEGFVRLVLKRPLSWALVGLVVVAVSSGLATRIRLVDDARVLVAEGDPDVARQLEALSDFTTVDNLLLHLEARGHAEELEPAARKVVESLTQSGAFADARFEVDPEQQLELVQALMPRRFLLDPRDPAELFAPATLDRSVAELREKLLTPLGIGQKQFLLRDPLGSMPAALSALSTAPGLDKLDPTSGRFLSKDGQSLLVITVPKGNPFGGADAERTMAAVAKAEQAARSVAPDVVVRPIGAHRFGNDAQQMIRRDAHFNVVTSLIAILVIFVALFRRPRLVVVALPPLLFGTAIAGGFAGLIGRPIHGIVLAFAAACLGLAIDYTIYLVSSTASAGELTREALPIAARRIGRSLTLAMTTTMAGLLALFFSNVPALRQMGVLALGAVFGAFLGALLWVPIILPLVSRATAAAPVLSGPWSKAAGLAVRRPGWVVGVALAVALVSGALAMRTRIDGDLRHLDTRTEQGEADLAAFSEAFGDPMSSALALIEAPSLGQGLESAAAVETQLNRIGTKRILSLTTVAPAPSVAEGRRSRWCAEPLAQRLAEAGTRTGFRAEAFAGFRDDLARLCGPEGAQLLAAQPAIAAFEKLLGRPLVREGRSAGVRLAVAFQSDDKSIAKARESLAALPGVTVIHRIELNSRLVRVAATDLPRLGGIALGLVALLMLLSFRNLRQPLLALTPCVLSIVTTLGVFTLTDTPINIINLCVFALLNGSGVDYGILMVDADPTRPRELLERAFSVSVAALCTLASFGTLATAHYYAMATIGRAVLLAFGTAAVYALFVTPALRALVSRAAHKAGVGNGVADVPREVDQRAV